ncbi:YcgJ family protein [Paraferrimonas sedimenticola]|uniref:Lipoprotein n=1 Tax=Paraferrimonas sedimenticola TaxID=375674 RepID=A0AA37RRB7_9GAMM|nr:YcgJ family protein [Paraferrimonas sedimenticola]GLP95063.1 hypothetical protein GCM10007895_03690 [Paraferrimonas sedimenticola]
MDRLLKTTSLCISLAVLAGCDTPDPSPSVSDIFSPEPGIVCDRVAGFCADSYGISMEFTKIFLGQAAQDSILKWVKQNTQGDAADLSVFTLSNGVSCSSEQRLCFKGHLNSSTSKPYTAMLYQSDISQN